MYGIYNVTHITDIQLDIYYRPGSRGGQPRWKAYQLPYLF